MRRARTLTTPWYFSSRPRISSAGALRATHAVALPHVGGADHVDQAGLVLEVEEDHALRRRRLLAVRDHAGHVDHRAIGQLAQLRGRDDAPRRQRVAHELGGVSRRRQAGRPEVGRDLLDLVHPWQRGGFGPGDHPRQLVGTRVAQRARGPQRLAPVVVEARERVCGGECLQRVGGRVGAPGEVGEVGERLLGTRLVDAVEQRVAQAAYVAEPHTHGVDRRIGVPSGPGTTDRTRSLGARLHRAVLARRLHARTEHLDPVPGGVTHDGVRRVEAHGLRVEQRATRTRSGSAA